MPRNHVVLLNSPEGRDLVKKACRKAGVTLRTLEQLITAEAGQQGKMRKAGLWEEFDAILDEAQQGEA